MAFNKNTKNLFFISKIFSKKYAHSWTALASVFNMKPMNKMNFSMLKENKGLFDVPELTSHEGFHILREQCILQTDTLIREATSPNRTRKMVEVFDELSNTLCKVADLSEFIRIAHPDSTYAKTAEIACNSVSSIVEKLNTDYNLYVALKNVVEKGDRFGATEEDNHVARLFLFDFEQCGIHLPEGDRCRVVELNNAILHLGQHFTAGSSRPRVIPKKQLPDSFSQLFQTDGKNVIISGLQADSANPLVREIAFRLYLQPEEHQEYLLNQMLICRHQLAKKCGFQTYSERALRGSLAENPDTVLNFLNLLSSALKSRADDDFKLIKGMKTIECGSQHSEVAIWDLQYYSYKMRKNAFRISNEEYSPYFSLGTCMEGLNNLLKALYGINLINVEMASGESWSPDVYKLKVAHETDGLLGYIYCDLFMRDGKQNQDCHFTIQGGKELPDGSYQIPIVVLMLNFPKPRWSCPSLLTPGMVDNLFHEMGHAMHSMLARTRYQHVTGTRCSTDFAEVPSVLMEYFANDPRVLSTFARHFQTGEPMPKEMLIRLCASKHLLSACEMQMQVFYSALDQIYHGALPLTGNTTEVLAATQARYYGLPYVPNTAWQLRFSHLVGYGAKYYSYLMSRAVASWIWQTYFENDPFNRNHGDLFRYSCLNFGGGKPSRKLVSEFLEREVTPSKLVDSLIKEIDDNARKIQSIK